MDEYYAPSSEHPWHVSYNDDTAGGLTSVDAVLATVDELDARLRADSEAYPQLVMVGHEGLVTYLSMGAGIGADAVPASFQAEPDENYASLSPEGQSYTEADGLDYQSLGEWLEVEARQLVPYQTVRAALEFFVSTGERPTTITWERL